jgi:SAM-dependent methyltransferase
MSDCKDVCVPFVPSPDSEVRTALEMGNLKPGEVFLELGCGDGRNLRLAALEFGARGIGYEFDHGRAELARANVAGLPVVIKEESFINAAQDIERADVLYMYLLQSVNQLIKPMLESHLKPTARVISRHFTFEGWAPVATWNGIYIYSAQPLVKAQMGNGMNLIQRILAAKKY